MDWAGDIRLIETLLIAVVFPQLLGYAAFRWAGAKLGPIKYLALLIPPIAFYFIADEYWGLQAEAIRKSHHHVCGAFGMAATLSTLFGTLFHLTLGLMAAALVGLVRKRRAKFARLQSSI
jgi:hypothetical protein